MLLVLLSLVIFPFGAKADTLYFKAGHNLTPTTDTLRQGEWTLGTYAVGYGITDEITLATSPWMIAGYNMPMVELRYQWFRVGNFVTTLEAMYFHTLNYKVMPFPRGYQQISFFGRMTASYQFSRNYTLHLSTGHQYFWDDTAPYSLDPIPRNNPYVLSISTLQEFRFDRHFGLFLEAGLLGLTYSGPDIQGPFRHLGASFFYQKQSGLLQVGASWSHAEMKSLNSSTTYSYDLIHPEVQIQFYL